ncbi:MAG: winged helix-turn-helix domain-containing protein [Bdellovibrionia bacterium]
MKKLKSKPTSKAVAKRRPSLRAAPRASASRGAVASEARAPESSQVSASMKRQMMAPSVRQLLQMAQMRSEKCELREARENYQLALEIAKSESDLRAMMEALAGLLRLAGEALDKEAIQRLEHELDAMMQAHPKQVPPMAWYCKGIIARGRGECLLAQRHNHRFLRAIRKEVAQSEKNSKGTAAHALDDLISNEDLIARGWVMMATLLWQRNHLRRSLHLIQILLQRFEARNLRGVNGMLYHLTGSVYERQRKFEEALQWYQKAHAAFLASHSWYYHLYVLYAYARLARHQRNFSQAYWYLDLIEKATTSAEFGLLKKEIATEKARLESDAVDLLVDSRQCIIQTREAGEIALGKQYVLLHILEALSRAHHGSEADRERGLSKAEIIEQVWKEKYRPEAHDNKLYYNINRLRKLIEPDVHKPKYLVNWREGYRLAPGLKVQFVGGSSGASQKTGMKAEEVN